MVARAKAVPGELKVRVLGGARTPLSDAYHVFLRWPWWGALCFIVASYLALNAVFAVLYLMVGGVQNLPPGSLADAFFFSVQTMGTIGYGAMYPVSRAANAVVVGESVAGLLVTAVATGLVFAKVSITRGRIVFARQVVISMMDGFPTLMLRLGNERSNRIIEAQLRVVLVRTERTVEGKTYYRMYDLVLVRDRSPAMTRSWTVMHRIVPGSPLHGLKPEDLKATEVELLVSLYGVDDVSLQTVHAQRRYTDAEILWGARHVDILRDEGDTMTLDLRRFHDTEATEPAPEFPYPVGLK